MEDQGVLAGFFALSFAFILVILIWAIISYLLTAFALYTMAKNDGATDGVLAFIPFVNSKIWGDLAKDKTRFLERRSGMESVRYICRMFHFNFVPILYLIATAVSIVLSIYLIYAILDRYGTNSILFTIIHTITFSVFLPIHLFIIRNEPVRYKE